MVVAEEGPHGHRLGHVRRAILKLHHALSVDTAHASPFRGVEAGLPDRVRVELQRRVQATREHRETDPRRLSGRERAEPRPKLIQCPGELEGTSFAGALVEHREHERRQPCLLARVGG